MIVASGSPVKFSKIVFPVWNYVQRLKFALVIANHSQSDFFTVNWVAEREKIREVYSTEFLLNTATIREAKLDCIWLLLA